MLPPLPVDVISEILSWLPVKAACRFRCLSKGCDTIISCPAFLASHKSRAQPLLVSVSTSMAPKVSSVLRLMDTDGNVLRVIKKVDLCMIYSCFNGPVCLCFGHYVNVVDLATGNVARTSAEWSHEFLYNIAVGCARPSRTYKVVSIGRNYEPCKVLALEDGAKWRQMQYPPTPSLVTSGCIHGSPVTVKGVMHFIYKAVTPKVDEEEYVLRFDLESEEWKSCIKGPRSGEILQEYKFMVNLDDTLCMVQWTSKAVCLIWVMIEDSAKGTWVKAYTIPINRTFDSLRPLTVMRDGRKLLFYAPYKLMETVTLQVYDPLTGTCTILRKFGSNLLGNYGLCVLNLECFVKPLPIYPPSMLSRLISCQWLRRLNPISLFYK